MKKTNIILIIILSFLLSSCKSAHVDGKNDIAIDEAKEQKYSKIIEGLKNDYVLDISHSLYGNHIHEVMNDIEGKGKTYQDYQKDSTCFYQAITDLFQSDYSIIKYLYKFSKDRHYRGITLELSDWRNRSYSSLAGEKYFKDNKFYTKMNNISLTLILNVYLNTEQKTIKLFLDSVYIINNSIKTADLYKKLDKIFEKYGYEDKERIRKALLEDFGACITLDGM